MATLDANKTATSPGIGRPATSILVVDDDADMREWVKDDLEHEGFVVETAPGGRAGVERVKAGGIDIVVTDVKMPDLDGLDLLREVREVDPTPFVIVGTGFGSIDTAIRAVKLGAYDYITKPFKIDQLLLGIDKALAERSLRSEVTRLREEVNRREGLDDIIGRSSAMQEIFALVRRLSASHANLLVTGEWGPGKELLARAIHAKSPRSRPPFVPVNCAAIPENLLESELFGYARGAPSTANADRQGLFVEANGGTLFLDEIAELPLSLQPKLLRVLQDGEVRPLGTNRSERVDVRVIAATNRDLERALREGRFREDLYYRLNVFPVTMPPLRERPGDIPLLVEHFVAKYAQSTGKVMRGADAGAIASLSAYPWPGNVRELENAVEQALVFAAGDSIDLGSLPACLREGASESTLALPSANMSLPEILDDLERQLIQRAYDRTGGVKTETARLLGIKTSALYYKLEKYGIGSTAGRPSGSPKP